MSEQKLNPSIETKDKLRIKLPQNLEFTGDLKTQLITTIDMAELIGEMFSAVMPDYYGCRIRINDGRIDNGYPNISGTMEFGSLYVDLYLKDSKGTSDVKNLKRNGETPVAKDGEKKASLSSRFVSVVGAQSNRAFTVTPETYEILEEFMPMGARTRWAEHTAEIYTQINAPYGQNEVVVVISGLSLNALITKMYGKKTEEGQFEYMATASTAIPYRSTEFIMQVAQLNADTVRKLQRTLGVYTPNTSIHTYNR